MNFLRIFAFLLLTAFSLYAHAQDQITYAGLNLPNQFTAVNYFQVGFSSGPVTFAQLSAIPFPQPGTTILCSGAGGTGCTIGSNPCVIGSSQVVATYVNGAWSCAGSGGGSGGSGMVWDTVSFVSVPSVIVPTTFTTLPLLPYCWDSNNVPVGSYPPVPSTSIPYTYTFTFSSNQSGYCGVLGPATNPNPPPPPGVFTVTPPSIPFGQVAFNTTSPPLLATLTNNSISAVTGIGFALGTPGSNCADFAIPNATNSCSTSLSPSSACTVGVTFNPMQTTLEQCTLIVTDSYGSGTQTVPLSGTGFNNIPPMNVNLTFTNGNGQGNGNVTTLPPDSSIACAVQASPNPPTSGQCSATYPQGTVVSFSGVGSGGSTFGSWGGITCNNPCTLTLNANTTVSVVFNPPSTAAPIAIVQDFGLVSNGFFPQAQTAGDLNIIVASWQDNSTTISSVTDTAGNTYTLVPGLNATKAGTGGSSSWAQVGPAINNGYGHYTCTMNHSAGDLVIVHLYSTDIATPTWSIANTASGGYTWKPTSTRVFAATGTFAGEDQTIWYSLVPANASGDIITATYTGIGSPTTYGIGCVEYSGALQNINTVLDAADNSFKNAASVTSTMVTTPITTAGANDMIFASCADVTTGASTWTASGAWAFVSGDISLGFAQEAANQLNIGTGTYTPTMTGSGTNGWQCIAAPFVAASGGSTPGLSESVYVAPNIASSSCSPTCNQVTVNWSGAAPKGAEVTGYEYSGMQTSGVIDNGGNGVAGTGTSPSPSSGNLTASYTNDLLFCATNALAAITTKSTGYQQRFIDPLNYHDIEDNYAVGANTYACAPALGTSANWITELVALKGSAAAPPGGTTYPFQITCSGLGSGIVQGSAGGINPICTAGVVSGPNTASLPASSTITLKAVASPPGTFGGFTGGGCSSSPTCIVTMSGPTTVNVSFTLKGGGGYSLQSQPSPQVAFYSSISSSVTTQKLPADIMSHLWGNTSTVTASDLMAKTTLLDCGGVGLTSCQLSETTNPTFMGIFTKPSPGREDYAAAFYYPLSTDTWYKDTSVATPTGVATVLFHAQNAATFPEGNEAVMVIWDQNTCYINSVQQTGCVVGYYHYSGVPGTIYSLPPASGCGTQSNPCNITFTYGSVASNLYAAQDNGYHPSSQSSAQLSPFGGTVREQELQSGAISHAITLAVDCINAGTEWVFPGISNGLGPCGTSYFGPNNVNRPPADSLFFLDYTPTQIANMGLPAWQTTLLTAMSTYGAYVTVTSGNGAGINFAGNDQLESSEAWKYASPTTGCSPSNCYNDPFWLWITGQKGLNGNNNLTQVGCGSESGGTDPSAIRCNGAFLTNIGRIQTATSNSVDAEGNTCSSAGGCYPSGHLHVADQCIAKGYAGIAGGCN